MSAAPADGSDGPRPCYRHPDRLTHISCVRCGRPICPEDMRPAAVGFQCPEEIKEARRTVRQPRTPLGGRMATGRSATHVLIGINVAVFIVTTLSGTGFLSGNPSLLFARLAVLPGRLFLVQGTSAYDFGGVAHGDYWRLLTGMFLHFGILHIASNMYVLFLVGPPLERALGRVRFVTLYLIAGLGGSVASVVFGSPTEIAAGASGAIFGLFGALYVVSRKFGGSTGPIIGTIVLNLFISVALPNIDIRAHLGGLVVGALLGAVFAYAPREQRNLVQAGGCVAVLAVLAVAVVLRGAQLRSQESHQQQFQERISAPAPVRAASPASVAGSRERSGPDSPELRGDARG